MTTSDPKCYIHIDFERLNARTLANHLGELKYTVLGGNEEQHYVVALAPSFKAPSKKFLDKLENHVWEVNNGAYVSITCMTEAEASKFVDI